MNDKQQFLDGHLQIPHEWVERRLSQMNPDLIACFENADRAAITSKKNGKDRITVFDPSAQKAASDAQKAADHSP